MGKQLSNLLDRHHTRQKSLDILHNIVGCTFCRDAACQNYTHSNRLYIDSRMSPICKLSNSRRYIFTKPHPSCTVTYQYSSHYWHSWRCIHIPQHPNLLTIGSWWSIMFMYTRSVRLYGRALLHSHRKLKFEKLV